MNDFFPQDGRRRVVIEQVTPSVEGGALPFKRVLGDLIRCGAHVFADSHDLLLVDLRFRKSGNRDWWIVPMRAMGNDEFAADIQPHEIGLYEFEVAGRVDHFGSWRDGFLKKADTGQPLDVELLIGAELIQAAAQRASGDARRDLQAMATFIGDKDRDLAQRVQLVRGDDLRQRMVPYYDADLETVSPRCLFLMERERAAFSSWYEFFPRSCGPDARTHGTFRDARMRLPEIQRMGFNVVYLPPIHPIGRQFRKGKNNALNAAPDDVGSPWAIGSEEGGHKAVHPELGTLEDFQEFIAAASGHGLEVAMDIAFQCAPDHPWVKEHPAWFRWRPDGTVQYAENPPKKYQDILPINFETEDWKNLWRELKSVFEYWIEAGVTIFRVDNPHTKSIEFWRWCILELKKVHPETIFLAEAFTRPKRKYRLAKGGFTHGYTYFTWRNSAWEMREYLEELTQGPAKEFFWPNFWPNTPDILHEDLQRGNRATYMGRYILAATLSSNLGIYGPAFELMDSEPFPGKEENNNNEKYQLKAWDWDAPGNLKDDIARVNAIRNGHRALQRTFNLVFGETDNPALLCYLKQNFDRSDQILVIVNMDWHHEQSGFVEVPIAHLGFGSDASYRVRDLYDPAGREYVWRGARNYVKLDPRRSPAHIFQVIRA